MDEILFRGKLVNNGAMVCTRTNDGYWRHGDDFCSYGRLKEHK